MTRIYANPGLTRRMTFSAAAMVAVGLYGLWELWSAAQAGAGAGSTGYLFGVAFVGGAIYGFRTIATEARDLVATLDLDPADGTAVATLWRPLGLQRLETPLARFSNWRFHVRIGARNARTFFLYADHSGYPRPLQFDLRHGVTVTDGLRAIAGEAVAEFERAVRPRPAPAPGPPPAAP